MPKQSKNEHQEEANADRREGRGRRSFQLQNLPQLRALKSSVRQTLLEFLANMGPSTIQELADRMGRTPATLYRHVDVLCRVGLIVDDAPRIKPRHHERVIKAVGDLLRLPTDSTDANERAAVADIVATDLRVAERSFRSAIEDRTGKTSGATRDTRAMSTFGWVSAEDLKRVNQLIDEAYQIVNGRQRSAGKKFVGLTIVMSPGPTSRSIGQ